MEIPPSELAAVVFRLSRGQPVLRGQELYRAVLDFYSTKHLTNDIEQRLRALSRVLQPHMDATNKLRRKSEATCWFRWGAHCDSQPRPLPLSSDIVASPEPWRAWMS